VGAFVVGAIGAFIFCLTTLPLALAGFVGLVIHGAITLAILVAGPVLASRGETENKTLLYGAATGAAIWIVTLLLVVATWDVD
jgi:hypothetical protein